MCVKLEHTVASSENGQTIEKILKKNFGVSAGLMTYLKLNGKIFINERIAKSVDKVLTGDIVCADITENEKPDDIIPCKIPLDIIYEDNCILVVNKPGGLAVHPSLGNYGCTLANAVMYHWKQNGEYHNYHIVNRLDKDTSGLCVIAKNRYSHSRLSQQIKDKAFKRKYKAVVHGEITPKDGVIEIPIRREADSIIKRIAAEDGKYAKTVYHTIELIENRYSLMEIELETGRTHQIRVHFSHIGHPLVGDWLYGNGDNERNLISRHALHAGYLKFYHPLNNLMLEFTTEIPQDMEKLLKSV